jgi:hypothetical protein
VGDHPSDEANAAEPDEQGGEVGDAIRRAAGDGDVPPRHDDEEGGDEVGDAIRRSVEDV